MSCFDKKLLSLPRVLKTIPDDRGRVGKDRKRTKPLLGYRKRYPATEEEAKREKLANDLLGIENDTRQQRGEENTSSKQPPIGYRKQYPAIEGGWKEREKTRQQPPGYRKRYPHIVWKGERRR